MRISIFISVLLLLASCKTQSNQRIPEKSEQYTRTFHEALRHKMSGNYERALELFNKCLKENPKDDASHFAIAQISLIQGNLELAKTHTILASQRDENNLYYQIELGYMHREMAEFEEGATIFEKIILEHPSNPNYYFEAAICWERGGKLSKAIQVMNNLESSTGTNIEATLKKHEWYKAEGKLKEAEKELTSYLEKDRWNQFVMATLVDFYLNTGQIKRGIEQLKTLIELDPKNGRGLLLLAQFEYENKDLLKAKEYYSKALLSETLSPESVIEALHFFIYHKSPSTDDMMDTATRIYDNDTILLFTGDFYLQSKEYKKAKKSFEKAIEINPGSYSNWERYMYLLYDTKQWEELAQKGGDVLKTFPLKTVPYYMMSVALNQIQNYDAAIESAEQGLFTIVDDFVLRSDLQGQMAESYFGKGLFNEAKIEYLKALQSAEGSQKEYLSFNFCLRLYEHNKDLNLSLELLDQLIENNGTDFEYRLLKGDILFLKEDYKNALELYKAILNIDSEPEKALINEKVGDAYAMLNNIKEAMVYWRSAKESGANSEILQKKITNEAYFE